MLDANVGIVGLGYVGLPLAVCFGKIQPTMGFDLNTKRISELKSGRDVTLEVSPEELSKAKHLTFYEDPMVLKSCEFIIVTVPTPIDENKQPDLGPLRKASEMLGSIVQPGCIIIYESTVYPGATEEFCVPIIEQNSGLTLNKDFYVGYSPERINPGDKLHRRPTKNIVIQLYSIINRDIVLDFYVIADEHIVSNKNILP